MNEIRYVAKVLDNGTLSAPENSGLRAGEEVEVVLRPKKGLSMAPRHRNRGQIPLNEDRRTELSSDLVENQRKLDELTKRVTLPKDLAQNWSHYLYGSGLKPCMEKS